MNLNFAAATWKNDDTVYASSYRFSDTPEFIQCEGWVENGASPEKSFGCDNVTILSLEKFKNGTEVKTKCAFFGISAPLITIAKEICLDGGVYKYGNYFEIVIWKNGINVWRMVMNENKRVSHKLVMGIDRKFKEGVPYTLTAAVNGDMLEVTADGISARAYMGEVYEDYHIGINACEGICRFYELSSEKSALEPRNIGWTLD